MIADGSQIEVALKYNRKRKTSRMSDRSIVKYFYKYALLK